MKIDAVPGITTKYRITPSRMGSYPVVCAELCGLGHSTMRSRVTVVSKADFDKWIAERKAPAAAAPGAPVDAKKLFTDGNGTATACGACHTLADAGTTATTGPELDKVVPDLSAEEIKESIVKPDAKVAQGFQAGIMPKDYGDTLSAEEVDALVKYLGEAAGK
jgi:cytochrome c oxidase subunit 2